MKLKPKLKYLVLSGMALMTVMSTTGAAFAEKIEIRLAFSRYGELYEELATKFEALHPEIDIITEASGFTFDDLTEIVMRSAVVDDLPEIAFGSVNHIRLFADRGLIYPITDLIAQDADWDGLGYMESAELSGQIKGEQWGLPFGVAETIVFYNADLVKQAGGDPDNFPNNWDDIIALGGKIDALSEQTSGFYMSHFEHTANWTYTALLNSAGGEMVSEDEGTVTFNSSEGMWALDLFRRFAEESGQIDISIQQARQAFSAGTLGIFASSASILGSFERNIGDSFEFGTALWPVPSDEGYLPGAGNAIMLLTDDPEKQKAAFEFIKYAVSPEGQTLIPKHTGYSPNNFIAMETPEMLGDVYANDPRRAVLLKQLDVTTGWYAFPGGIAPRVSEVMRDHIRDVATLKRTPEEVMPEMAADVQALIDSQ